MSCNWISLNTVSCTVPHSLYSASLQMLLPLFLPHITLPISSPFIPTLPLMAPSTKHTLFLSFAITLLFLSSLPPFSGGIDEEELRKMVLGSRPPACVNKCLSCRPCEATLVIPPHQRRMKRANNYQEMNHREDGSYYLLSWKCRCGDKLYQP